MRGDNGRGLGLVPGGAGHPRLRHRCVMSHEPPRAPSPKPIGSTFNERLPARKIKTAFQCGDSESLSEGENVFFSEEKKQKTFVRWGYGRRATYAKVQEFFGSFFQKRTSLILATAAPQPSAPPLKAASAHAAAAPAPHHRRCRPAPPECSAAAAPAPGCRRCSPAKRSPTRH